MGEEGLEYKIEIEERTDILRLLDEINAMGIHVLDRHEERRMGSHPDGFDNSYVDKIYHIGSATVKITHNSMVPEGYHSDYYFNVKVYGNPSPEFSEWLSRKTTAKP
jgi:hypothetical protein